MSGPHSALRMTRSADSTGSNTGLFNFTPRQQHRRASLFSMLLHPSSMPVLLALVVFCFVSVQILAGSAIWIDILRSETVQLHSSHPDDPMDRTEVVRYYDTLQYGIVVDGGSSGSRIHIFRFRSPMVKDQALPLIQYPVASLSQTPGLSTFTSKPSAAGGTMQPLLEFAYDSVPPEMHAGTPVFLMATAGLRMVESDKAEAILDSCRSVLKRSKFLFVPEWASVIPGYKEGVFGWVAANYAANTLVKRDPSKTVGVLELGGASSQVTFAPGGGVTIPSGMKQSVNLGGTHYTLYTHSFLGLGQEAAQDTLAAALVQGGVINSRPVQDPCTPPGFRAAQPTVVGRTHTGEAQLQLSVSADGNFTSCMDLATRLVVMKAGGIPTPTLQGEFLATENFFYTAEFFGLGTKPTLGEMARAGSKYCSSSWDEVFRIHGPESAPGGEKSARHGRSQEELLKYCFSAAYIVAFLNNGLGIELSNERIHFSNSIGGVSVDWALGALLLEVAPKAQLVESAHDILSADGLISRLSQHDYDMTKPVRGIQHAEPPWRRYLLFFGLIWIIILLAIASRRILYSRTWSGKARRYGSRNDLEKLKPSGSSSSSLRSINYDVVEKGH